MPVSTCSSLDGTVTGGASKLLCCFRLSDTGIRRMLHLGLDYSLGSAIWERMASINRAVLGVRVPTSSRALHARKSLFFNG